MSCTVNEILINSITVTTKFIHAIFLTLIFIGIIAYMIDKIMSLCVCGGVLAFKKKIFYCLVQ